MLCQLWCIIWQCIVGELGVLLLEVWLIKEQQLLFNKWLWCNKQFCVWLFVDDWLQIVYVCEVDFLYQQYFYGLFVNWWVVLQMLQSFVDEQCFCYGLFGLELFSCGCVCFCFVLGCCVGVCCGKESVEVYKECLLVQMSRLQLVCWLWVGFVVLEECGLDMMQYYVIYNWLWLGVVELFDQVVELICLFVGFDQDGYKIFCKFLFSGDYLLYLFG